MKQLEQLIMAYQKQADKGILTDKGISYLEGLKRAKQLISLDYE